MEMMAYLVLAVFCFFIFTTLEKLVQFIKDVKTGNFKDKIEKKGEERRND